jgi:general secretion pathway protein A
VVNVVCDRALLGAYVEGKQQVDRKVLARAVREVRGNEGVAAGAWSAARWVLGVAGLACAGLVAAFFGPAMFGGRPDHPYRAAAEVPLVLAAQPDASALVSERVATPSLVADDRGGPQTGLRHSVSLNERMPQRAPSKKDN